MLNEKKIKAIILISLLLIESFVWVINGPKNFWSLGFFGGDGGHTSVEQPGSNPAENPAGGETPEEPAQNNGDDQPADNTDRELALQQARAEGLLILVNKTHSVDKDYKPDDLTKVRDYAPDRAESTRYMRAEAAKAFGMLVDKASEDGVVIKMTTAYRSYDFQKILFDSYVEKEGEEKANTFSAKPGQSEHQTGLAVDVSSPSVDYQLSNDYGKTKEGIWLADHAFRFGFILRFPKGKEDITGYQYEPWHLRYVGLTAAKEIYDQDITLEEYLQENNME